MSGHSKWSQIKHKKALTDAKKGKLFSKIAAQISIAAKHGGAAAMNPNLRVYLDKARAAGMPKENIERAIKRGTGELGGAALEEAVYEAYGAGGVGIIIEAVTDNKNRTLAEIKSVLNKSGGKLADSGSVSYQFEKQGIINVEIPPGGSEEGELTAIDLGAIDFAESENTLTIYTKLSDFNKIKQTLESQEYTITSAEISFEPNQTVSVDDNPPAGGKKEQVLKLLDALDELNDVTNISTNAEL